MSDPGNGQRLEVHCSGAVANDLYQMQDGVPSPLKQRIAAAFEKVVHELEANAKDFGEPLYRLPTMRMQIRSAVVSPLGVVFGVCEDRPVVFINRCRLLATNV